MLKGFSENISNINNKLKNLSDYLTNQKVSHFVREALLVVTNNLNQVIYLIKKE